LASARPLNGRLRHWQYPDRDTSSSRHIRVTLNRSRCPSQLHLQPGQREIVGQMLGTNEQLTLAAEVGLKEQRPADDNRCPSAGRPVHHAG